MVAATDGTGILGALREVVEAGTADRVFGQPVTEQGTVVLPVARVSGGGGGGGGTGPAGEGQPEGSGGGFGTSARGLGVFVLREGRVSWHPAVDINKIVLGGQLVAITALLVARSVFGGRKGAGKGRVLKGRVLKGRHGAGRRWPAAVPGSRGK